MNKLVVVGDIHLQSKSPKYESALDTLNWVFNNENLNNKDNSILFLGDIAEINSSYKIYGTFVDFLINKSLFHKIWIIQGNHDCVNSLDGILHLFSPLPHVEVITEWKILDFYNTKILALPFYHHEGIDSKEPMVECYSNLYKNELIRNTKIDYCCGHIEDETNHFSSKNFCDLSKLNVKHFLHGHIHTPNIQNGGHYLGSATLNSVSEKDDTKYIAVIDGETKEFELQEIPRFLGYYTVEYPNKLEKPKTPYAIFTIKNALDKQTVLNEYSKQAEELGFILYTNKVLKQKVAEIETGTIEQTEKPTFEKFAKSVGLSNEVFDICNEIIRLKSEE